MSDNLAKRREEVDVESLMQGVRERIRSAVENGRGRTPTFIPREVRTPEGKISPLILSEELNYLNSHWHDWYIEPQFSSHRKFLGPLITRFKRFIVNVLWNSLLKDYFDRERQFQAQLVRFLNSTARYIDAKDTEFFFELIKKIDHDVDRATKELRRTFEKVDGTVRSVELRLDGRIDSLEGQLGQFATLKAQIAQLDDVLRGLERTFSLFSKSSPEPHSVQGEAPATPSLPNIEYLLLENRYRGSEELIKSRVADYATLFVGASQPVLDLGCGRGEFLEVLRERGIAAHGIDMDRAMVMRCKEKGLEVELSEGLSYLRSLPDRSLGGIFAAQVVEHLTTTQLEELFSLAKRKVVLGGKVAFETINPQSVVALARNFFRDPTHIWPLHPDTLRFVMEMKGIKTVDIIMKAPYPGEATLQPLALDSYLPARWLTALQTINDNIERLNNLLFGYQDYCIVGEIE